MLDDKTGELVAPRRQPSPEACRRCEARDNCAVRANAALKMLGDESLTLQVENDGVEAHRPLNLADVGAFADRSAESLSPAQLVSIVLAAPFLREVLKDAEAFAQKLLAGADAPDELRAVRKLVRSKGALEWLEDDLDSVQKAVQAIRWKDPLSGKSTGLKRTDVTKQTLRTPTQIRKIFEERLKKGFITKTHMDAFERLVRRPDGGLMMVPLSDERPNAIPDLDEMFGSGEDADGPPAPDMATGGG